MISDLHASITDVKQHGERVSDKVTDLVKTTRQLVQLDLAGFAEGLHDIVVIPPEETGKIIKSFINEDPKIKNNRAKILENIKGNVSPDTFSKLENLTEESFNDIVKESRRLIDSYNVYNELAIENKLNDRSTDIEQMINQDIALAGERLETGLTGQEKVQEKNVTGKSAAHTRNRVEDRVKDTASKTWSAARTAAGTLMGNNNQQQTPPGQPAAHSHNQQSQGKMSGLKKGLLFVGGIVAGMGAVMVINKFLGKNKGNAHFNPVQPGGRGF